MKLTKEIEDRYKDAAETLASEIACGRHPFGAREFVTAFLLENDNNLFRHYFMKAMKLSDEVDYLKRRVAQHPIADMSGINGSASKALRERAAKLVADVQKLRQAADMLDNITRGMDQ